MYKTLFMEYKFIVNIRGQGKYMPPFERILIKL